MANILQRRLFWVVMTNRIVPFLHSTEIEDFYCHKVSWFIYFARLFPKGITDNNKKHINVLSIYIVS